WSGATALRARRQVAGPAWGLLMGSVLGLFIGVPVVLTFEPHSPHVFIATSLITAPAALVQALGAVMMLRLRWYPLAATASIRAMIPWSPAYFINLPFGIWACIVLGKPTVTEEFFNPRHSPVDEPAAEPNPKLRMVGRVLSYVRSVCGYFLPSMAGR